MIRACSHCGEDTKKIEEEFCCLGCSAAYKIINKLGFENYYKLREIDPKIRKIKPEIEEEIDVAEFVFDQKDGSHSVSLMVQGLHCAACVWLIESILKKQQNVITARINLFRKTLFLRWKGDAKDGNKLIHIISEIGYKLLPFDEEILNTSEKKYNDSILRALAVAGFGVGNVMLFSFALWFYDVGKMGIETRNLMHFFSSLIALPVIVFSSRPFFSSAFKSIKAGYPNMDLAIAIAIFLACAVSLLETFRGAENVYFDSAVMLIFFLLIGRYLDLKARKKAFAIASEFTLLAASFGRVEDGKKIKILPSKQLQEGMILLVGAGEKIAADGVVIDGESEIDMSLISGETLPKKIQKNHEVFAGTINLISPLRIRITKSTQNSLLSKIISLSDGIGSAKNHYVRVADRLSKIYTPAVHLLAFLTFCLWCFYFKIGWEGSLMNATAVLIITCPCALALAVPIIQTIAISNFIKKGILVKSGEALEKLNEIDVIVFDKTGSLTIGKPRLCDVFLLRNEEKISLTKEQKNFYLKLAASLAKKSRHPISRAISASYLGDLEELQVEESQGLGLSSIFENKILKLGRETFCTIAGGNILRQAQHENNVTLLNDDSQLNCFMKFGEDELVFFFEDEIKTDAKLVIERLKQMDKKIILLSGDVEKTVERVAKKLAIAEFYFEQTPVSKVEILEKVKAKNKKFIMIGDGLNDAPSLALADVSISFAQAADISQNIADVVIQGQKLQPIIDLINFSQRAISLMKQNLLIALLYNLVAVPFAIAGFVVPLIAAIAMSSSSLLVLFNSLRMNKGVNL
jgi:P-type Cu2+ transporter